MCVDPLWFFSFQISDILESQFGIQCLILFFNPRRGRRHRRRCRFRLSFDLTQHCLTYIFCFICLFYNLR